METTHGDVPAALESWMGTVAHSEFRGQTRVTIPRDKLHGALEFLKNRCEFDLLADVTCVDYLNYPGAQDRFGLVYVLVSQTRNQRLVVRTFLNEPETSVPTVTDLWEGANWLEREVWDMFGIAFVGHPDLRRILLPDEFAAHPLRKDYPLQGRGERHNFPVLTRAQG